MYLCLHHQLRWQLFTSPHKQAALTMSYDERSLFLSLHHLSPVLIIILSMNTFQEKILTVNIFFSFLLTDLVNTKAPTVL